MATIRSRCISTKVTEDEYQLFVARAGLDTVSAWARDALLAAANTAPAVLVLTAEVVALRIIVLTALFRLAHGETLTPEEMQRLIDHADSEKLLKAQQRLAQSRSNRPS